MNEQYQPSWHDAPLEAIIKKLLPEEAFAPEPARINAKGELLEEAYQATPSIIARRVHYRHPEWALLLSEEDVELCLGSDGWQDLGNAVKELQSAERVKNWIISGNLSILNKDQQAEFEGNFYSLADDVSLPLERVREIYESNLVPDYSLRRLIVHHLRRNEYSLEDPAVQAIFTRSFHDMRDKYAKQRQEGKSWEATQTYTAYREAFIETAKLFLVEDTGDKGYQYKSATRFAQFLLENKINLPVMEPYSNETELSQIYFTLMTANKAQILPVWLQLDKEGLFDEPKKGDPLGRSMTHKVLSFRDLSFLALAFNRDKTVAEQEMTWRLCHTITRGVQTEWLKNADSRFLILISTLGVPIETLVEKDRFEEYNTKNLGNKEMANVYETLTKNFSSFDEMISKVVENYAIACPLRDELLCYSWAAWTQFHPDQGQSTSDRLLPYLDGKYWEAVGRGSFSATFADQWGRPYDEETNDYIGIDDPRYRERLKGKGIPTQDYLLLTRRRYPFSDAMQFPWTYSTGLNHGTGTSFSEYYLFQRLLLAEDQLVQTTSLHDQMAIIQERTAGIRTAARDVYIDFYLREALLNDTLESSEDAEKAREYFSWMMENSQEESGLTTLLLEKYIKLKSDFFDDFDTAYQTIISFLPNTSYTRNKYLQLLEKNCSLSIEQVRQLQMLYINDIALGENGEKHKGAESSLFELVQTLDIQGKEDLLCWLLNKNNPKPKLFLEMEKNYDGNLDDMRDIFLTLSPIERSQIIQRIVVGPEGIFDELRTQAEKDATATRISTVLIPERTEVKHLQDYRRLFSIGLLTFPPERSTKVISNIVNKWCEAANTDTELKAEEVIYIAVGSFNATGIKGVQLISDFPWVDPEIRDVFTEGMWNVGLMLPSEIIKVWDAEQERAGFENNPLSEFKLLQFIKPLGNASTRQAYLVRVQFPNGEVKPVVLKTVKGELIDINQLDTDIADIELYLTALRNHGYNLDIPLEYGQILKTLLVEERDSFGQAVFQEQYKTLLQTDEQIPVRVPETYAAGEFIMLEEYIEGNVLATQRENREDIALHMLARSAKDVFLGMINPDVSKGNIIQSPEGPTLIDYGMRLPLQQNPQLHQAIVSIWMGTITGNKDLFSSGMQFFGNDEDHSFLESEDLSNRLEGLRKIIIGIQHEEAPAIYKVMWLMYRQLALYNQLTPEMQQLVPSLMVGGFGGLAGIQ